MAPENLAHPSLGPVPEYRLADRLGRRDEAGAPERRPVPTDLPPDGEGPAIHADTFLSDVADVALAAKVLPRAETHGDRNSRNQTTVRRLRPFLRREASTLRPPRVDFRARKPILRARFLRCGRKVGCMVSCR